MPARQPPRPGVPVRGSTTGRPLMAALDLLGRRWALRILWELRDGPLGARALLSRCGQMSSSVLYERLRELTGAGLVAEAVDAAFGHEQEVAGHRSCAADQRLAQASRGLSAAPSDVPRSVSW